jgi:parallel beta-helix repeat protein
MLRTFLALLAFGLLSPAHAAESGDSCTGIITSLPTTISTPGNWCLTQHVYSAITSGAAITVAANDVTIDCNDFKVGGLPGNINTNTVGISATDRVGTTVRNCVVRGFIIGIQLAGTASGGQIEDNRLDQNTVAGISLAGSGHLVRRNRIFDTGGRPGSLRTDGIFSTADFSRITDNAVMGLTVAAVGGDVVGYSVGGNANEVARNYLTDVVPNGGDAVGIDMGSSAGATVHRNQLLSPAAVAGTAILSGVDNQCSANSYEGWGTGIVGCTDGGSNFGD